MYVLRVKLIMRYCGRPSFAWISLFSPSVFITLFHKTIDAQNCYKARGLVELCK